MSMLVQAKLKTILVLLAIAVLACPLAAKPKSKSVLKSKQSTIRSKIREVRHKIHVKESEKRTVIGQLSVVESKLEDAQSSLSNNKIRLLGAQAKLARTNERLERTRKQLKRREGLLERRVVDIYEGENIDFLNVVLGAADMWTFLTRASYLQAILNSDSVLIRQIRADKAAIERDKIVQARTVNQISKWQVELQAERDQVSSLADVKRDKLTEIEHDKDLMEDALAALERESARIESEIQRYQSSPRGRKMLARAFRGGLSLPCSGRFTSRFGYRVHPITRVYKLHTGVDISVPSGTAIHAAADGEVIDAGYMGAYGYAVVIDHGGGVSTLYGHCSRLLVSRGGKVNRGQVIAKSGSTGYSTGPHCHFEKRVNGKPVNPL